MIKVCMMDKNHYVPSNGVNSKILAFFTSVWIMINLWMLTRWTSLCFIWFQSGGSRSLIQRKKDRTLSHGYTNISSCLHLNKIDINCIKCCPNHLANIYVFLSRILTSFWIIQGCEDMPHLRKTSRWIITFCLV